MRNSRKKPDWQSRESIWTPFADSGKKHLFITGSRKSGKSTMLRALLEQNAAFSGIITRAVRKGDNAPDYILLEDINNSSDNAIIGIKNQQGNGVSPCLSGFEETGVQILKRCLDSESLWIAIDEIGFLENEAVNFQKTIRTCLDFKRVIAVLRKDSTPFLDELSARQDAFLVDLGEM